MSESILAIDAVSKSYGKVKAVDNVSLNINRGENLALLGHNGAGKTTLFKLALSLTRPTSGNITAACGKNNIGYLPENIAFYDQMSAAETLTYYACLKNSSGQQVNELLDLVGLAPFQHRRIRTYSKGMKQRLGFAQALLGKPALLFLDEPTSGLDPVGRETLFDIIKRLNAQGTAVIFSSHILSELENKVKNIAIMKSGRLIAYGDLDTLRTQAEMPAQISLRVGAGHKQAEWKKYLLSFPGSRLNISNKNGDLLLISAPLKEKKSLLAFILGSGLAFQDINTAELSLADIYIKICQEEPLGQPLENMAA